MKKSLFVTMGMALLLAARLSAQTIEVSGEYQGNVLWEADTVKLMGDVVIEPDGEGQSCLTVTKRTWVIAEGYYRITVHNGSFFALGEDKANIVFTASDTTDFYNPAAESGWRGIHLLSDQSSAQDSVVMEYCEVRYGKIVSGAPEGERFGAGVEVKNKKHCHVAHCRFLLNRNNFDGSSPTTNGGGGLCAIDPGTILVEHCVFHDNYAWWGASIRMNGLRHFTVRNCEFYNNSGHYGTALDMHVGELSLTASGPQVYNNYIHGNHGNTMYLGWEGVGRLHDNVIVNNDGYSPVLGTTAPNYSHYYNNTIANNLSEGHIHGYGSGIWTNGQQKIYNNVFWGNTGVWFERMDPNHPDPTVFSNCNGTISGTGDVFGDPQFVNPTSGYGPQYDVATTAIHWKLQQTSPCINAGATSNTSFYPETDFAGDPRVVNGRIDMGAFEFPDLDAVEENDSDKVVYPNPGSDFFVVLTEAGETLLVVYDLAGQKVYESRCQGNATTVATQDWPSGMYFWRLSGSSAPTKTGKWIKK